MGAEQLSKYIDRGKRESVKEFIVKTIQCFADLSDFLSVQMLLASLQRSATLLKQSEGRTLVSSLDEKKVENSTRSAGSLFSEEPHEKQNDPHSEGERGQMVLRRFWLQMRGPDIFCFRVCE